MMRTYKAKLTGNQLEWTEDTPSLVPERDAEVFVIFLQNNDRARRVAALESLAAMGGIKSIPDPSAWQREIRQDRPLPGRED